MIIPPGDAESAAPLAVYRGPNIGPPPANEPLPDQLEGVVTLKVGDNITTDHIIPAGKRMKYRSNIPKYSEFLFEILDGSFPERAMKIRDSGRCSIIVAGFSYGQGSSREHAAICPMYVGVKAILAKSFERIHAANLINFGILPLVFVHEADYERLTQGDRLLIPDLRRSLAEGIPLNVKNADQDFLIEGAYELSDRQKKILLAGGALNIRR